MSPRIYAGILWHIFSFSRNGSWFMFSSSLMFYSHILLLNSYIAVKCIFSSFYCTCWCTFFVYLYLLLQFSRILSIWNVFWSQLYFIVYGTNILVIFFLQVVKIAKIPQSTEQRTMWIKMNFKLKNSKSKKSSHGQSKFCLSFIQKFLDS